VDDLNFPGMLYGVTVRNPARRGKIRGITFEPGVPWDEFTIVTANDIPGKNYVALILNDQPFLADEITAHGEEAVVLLAHPDRYLVEEARRRVRIDVEALPCIDCLEDSLSKKEIVWGDDNIFK
jgi:xanthine dehydrogenase molybdopterin-binding subunit B